MASIARKKTTNKKADQERGNAGPRVDTSDLASAIERAYGLLLDAAEIGAGDAKVEVLDAIGALMTARRELGSIDAKLAEVSQ